MDTFFPPQLFVEPPEGWVAWSLALVNERRSKRGESPIAPFGAESISGQLVQDHGPAWAQALALPRALTGELEEEMLSGDWKPPLDDLARRIRAGDEVESLTEMADEAWALAESGVEDAERLAVAAGAKATRWAFESGRSLWIAPYGAIERYVSFYPALRWQGGNQYLVGDRTFAAGDHIAALQAARRWYLSAREKEIEAAKERAKNVSAMHTDVLAALLRRDKALIYVQWVATGKPSDLAEALSVSDDDMSIVRCLEEAGPVSCEEIARRLDRTCQTIQERLDVLQNAGLASSLMHLLAWQNRAHGLYGVDGGAWLYSLEASPEVVARLAVLAYRSRFGKDAPPLCVAETRGRVADLLGFDGWRPTEKGYCWSGGAVEGSVVRAGSTPVAQVKVTDKKIEVHSKGKPVVESPVIPGFAKEDCLAWAAFRALRKRAEE